MGEAGKVYTAKEFGKYRLIAHLATGGMADIFLATQMALAGFQKLIVIKRILANLSREQRFVEMFLDEARIAAMLNHPNVVQIFDLGRIQGQYFIAMEYLPGESLSLIIRACRNKKMRIPNELAAGMVLQAAEGLHHAHTMTGRDGKPLNIVHRDVSPQNIIALYDGVIKVVDFGIAKAAMRTTKTHTGTLKGKYAYMSPEQILGSELDARSDVFSLGVVLWECLVRRKLYNQENDLKLLQAITEQDAPSPRSIDPEVPEALAEITLKALARKREERYQSAAEFSAALRSFLKSSGQDWDNVAISRFMHQLFSERMQQKRQLIENALAATTDLQEHLFSDLSDFISDTEHSVPRSPLPELPKGPPPQGTEPSRRRSTWLAVLALLGVVTGAGALVLFALRQADGREKAAESGMLPHEELPDAGVPPSSANPPATVVTAIAEERSDAGPPSADAGLPEKAAQKMAARVTKTPRTVLNRAGGKLEPPPLGPPGKLRLTTDPWTDVYHQGRHLGQTPLVDVELPSGMVDLRVVNREQGIDKIITVLIKPGEKTTKRFNLRF